MRLVAVDLLGQGFLLSQAHGAHLADRRGNVLKGDPAHASAFPEQLTFQGNIDSKSATDRRCGKRVNSSNR